MVTILKTKLTLAVGMWGVKDGRLTCEGEPHIMI